MKPRRIFAIVIICLAVAIWIGAQVFFTVRERRERQEISWKEKKQIAPSGGRFFAQRVELKVPQLFQADEKWRDDYLGATTGTLGGEGCAITSIAMIFQYYGIDTDPQRLNWFLDTNGGYTPEGWVYWEKAAEIAPNRVRHVYEDLPSYELIDSNLEHSNPVIVKVKLKSGVTHFVVIAGKDGLDYLIRDPAGLEKGVYPLKELGSNILGLRFYESTPVVSSSM